MLAVTKGVNTCHRKEIVNCVSRRVSREAAWIILNIKMCGLFIKISPIESLRLIMVQPNSRTN